MENVHVLFKKNKYKCVYRKELKTMLQIKNIHKEYKTGQLVQ